MAISVTGIYSGGSANNNATTTQGSTSVSSTTFTPANNCLLVVALHQGGNNAANVVANISLSGGGLTWTRQDGTAGTVNVSGISPTVSGYKEALVVFTAPVTTGASMSLTASGLTTPSDSVYFFTVFQVTGYNTSSFVGVSAINTNNTAANGALTLSGSPASTSATIAFCATLCGGAATAAPTAGSGFTAYGGSPDTLGQGDCIPGSQFRTGSTSSSVAWTDVAPGDTELTGVVVAFEILVASSGPATPSDCSFLFQPTQLPRPVPIVNIQQRKAYAPQDKATPSPLTFWFQPPFLGPVPKTLDTNQPRNVLPETRTRTDFWLVPKLDLQCHVPTIYTAQSFVCNPTIGPPVPVDAFWVQAPDLLNHPHSLDTNQPKDNLFAGWTNNTPSSLGFYTQALTLLPHAPLVNIQERKGFSPQDSATPSSLGFLAQAPALLTNPKTLDTNQRVPAFIAPAAPVPSNQVNEYWSFAPIGHLAIGQGTLPAGTPTPTDCSFLFQPSALLNHPQTLDTNQSKENFFSGWANATPTQFGFWTQAPNLLRHAVTLDTNQSVDEGWTQGLTPASLAFWHQPEDLLRHPSTLDTNQAFNADFAGRPGATPSQLGFWTQAPDLLRHASTLDTKQPVVSYQDLAEIAQDVAFWIQSPDLLRHPATVDTNQPFNAEFAGVPGVTPTQFGFWTQAPDLLRHPNTVDTRQQFEFVPPIPGLTPADCSFLFQPSALLNHVPTLDTNQPLDDTFFGWAGNSVTPTNFGFFTQAPDLLRHPATLDTRQQFEFNPPPGAVTPADCSFLYQPSALLNHPATLDTNQSLDDTFFGWQKNVTPTALGFWTQAPDLTRHPVTIDTNQSRVSYQDKATPSALGFWTQAPDLLRHASTIDTNQAFVFNPPVPGATPSALWWFQPPDLLRHAPHLDTNLPRLVSQVGATPSALAWWRQPEDLFKHPATLNTQQSFEYLPPPQPPFGWLIQAQDLLRHPVPFILGMQSFAELPPVIHVNRLTKVYFFD